MKKTAVIIPCYNEEKRINVAFVKEIIKNDAIDVYFANDGSNDNTLQILKAICQEWPKQIKVLDFKKNEGKANTIYKAVQFIGLENQYDYIGYFDADFSTPVVELIRMVEEIEANNYDFIFSSRVKLLNSKIKRKWHRHIIGRFIITFINFKFNLGVYDTQCGAKIFSKRIISEAFSNPFLTSWLFDIEIFIKLKNKNLLINAKEFALQEWTDVDGSKLSWKTGFKIIKEIYILLKNYSNEKNN